MIKKEFLNCLKYQRKTAQKNVYSSQHQQLSQPKTHSSQQLLKTLFTMLRSMGLINTNSMTSKNTWKNSTTSLYALALLMKVKINCVLVVNTSRLCLTLKTGKIVSKA